MCFARRGGLPFVLCSALQEIEKGNGHDSSGKTGCAARGNGRKGCGRRVCALCRPAHERISAGALARQGVAFGLYGLCGHFVCDKREGCPVDRRALFHPGRAPACGQRHRADAHGPARRAHGGTMAGRNAAAGRRAGRRRALRQRRHGEDAARRF